MRTALLLLLALAATPLAAYAASQTVWKWVDDKGVTHYSDRSVPGATKVELNVGSPSSTGNVPADTTSPSQPAAPSGPAYRNFEIWKPQKEESIVNTAGRVTVNIRVDPPLQRNHVLQLYLDGKLVEGFPANTNSYELKEVPRGTHAVVAVVTDRRGAAIQESDSVSFTVRQESIANPPVGPALRPPPKAQPRVTTNKLRTTQPTYAQLNRVSPVIDPRTNAPVVPKVKPKGPKQGK